MSTHVSRLADVHPAASLGQNCVVGPFCSIGADAVIGDGCRLVSHVVVTGRVAIGPDNTFHPHTVIGGTPQDKTWSDDAQTSLEIGEGNEFREGVTVNRGAEKEDGITRVGNRNLLMANSHVAHNCHVHNDTILVNGVLLGGHVHVQDRAVISGNSVVHHFSTVGTLAMVSGGCRVPHDIPPYMMAAGSDNPEIKTVNLVGMRRAGISNDTIRMVKRAYKLIFREAQTVAATRDTLIAEYEGLLPIEVARMLAFIDAQGEGRMGRQREGVRPAAAVAVGKAA